MSLETVTGFFTGIPLDWIILGALVVLIALDSLRSGIGRACAIALALPLALLLFSELQHAILLSDIDILFSTTWAQAGIFALLAIASYILVRRMSSEYIESGTGEPIQALLAGGAATIVCIVVYLQLPVFNTLWDFSGRVDAVFAEPFRLWWLLGAYAGLAFARG